MAAVLLISHSRRLAQGGCEVIGAMARSVRCRWVGGEASNLGVSVDEVAAALAGLVAEHDEVVVVGDLGSTVLAGEAALELLGEVAGSVRVLRGVPFLEGALAAAMALELGGDAAAAAAAAARACSDLGAAR